MSYLITLGIAVFIKIGSTGKEANDFLFGVCAALVCQALIQWFLS